MLFHDRIRQPFVMQFGADIHAEREQIKRDKEFLTISVFLAQIRVFALNSGYDIILRFHFRSSVRFKIIDTDYITDSSLFQFQNQKGLCLGAFS